jgi:putative CocE/NonD family hydrolase
VLTYTSVPLTEDLEIIGEVRMVLYASSSGRDTDWVVKLCDQHPDGSTLNLCDGVVRVSYQCARGGSSYQPGDVRPWEISLWSTAAVIPAGHRLRVVITSSDFPRYDRNPNTGESPGSATTSEPALQRVFHTPSRPSRIELPIVAR